MDLRERFCALWERIGAKGDPNFVFDGLVYLYQEGSRNYHNLDHVSFGLSQFDLISQRAEHPDWVEFAWFFHDSIHSRGIDNESESARFAIETLAKAGLGGWLLIHVGSNIMYTKHDKEPTDIDSKIICDIDLAILGQARPDFMEYERKVREEYAVVDEEVFWKRRKEILMSFLVRPKIYYTDPFRKLYEDQARANLKWTIDGH